MSIPGGAVADAFRYVYTRVRARRHSVKKKEARERKGRKRRGRVSPSCSGRGHGTNAAPVSVLVSRTPHPSVPAIPRVPRHRGTPHLAARYNAIVGIVVRGGRSQFRPRPVPLPVYQPGALVKCFSSRIMTRSARLWPPLLSLPLLSLFRLVSFSSSPSHARSLSSYPCSFPFFLFPPIFKRFPPRSWIHLPLAPTGLSGSFQDAKFALASARRTRSLAWPSFCLVQRLPASNSRYLSGDGWLF